ncbi:HEPN domain-containing protein [Deminuibacter soli]|nr:HEPN domain-containing protein [Deminuibacter soli]
MENTSSLSGSLQESPFDQIIPVITQSVPVERIYLTGRQRHKIVVENIFNVFINPSTEESSYDLVVIVSAEERRSENELQDVIENRCKVIAPVNVLIMALPKFRQLLDVGHPFIFAVTHAAMLLFDSGTITATLNKLPDEKEFIEQSRADITGWSHSATVFLDGAGYYVQAGHPNMSAFMLHQATEHCLIGLIRTMTGYKVHTHNIDKLLRYARSYSLELNGLFPRNTPEEIHLFQLLQKAYVDARYKPTYTITQAEVLIITTRVQKIQTLVQEICHTQLNALENSINQAGIA